MRKSGTIIATGLVLLATSCGNGGGDGVAPTQTTASTSSTSTSSAPVAVPTEALATVTCKGGPACSNKEVTETGCDDGNANGKGYVSPFDAIPGMSIAHSNLQGTLTLRQSNPQACTNIFWAHFAPAASNGASFEVYAVVNGKPSPVQASLEHNVKEWAWSKGVYAPKGAKVTACVRIKGSKDNWCLVTTTIV